jgi:hypothetical protein
MTASCLSSAADLHLGSTVDLQAGTRRQDGSAAAMLIRVHEDLVGPVTSTWDASTGKLGVMGQAVAVDGATTFVDGIAGGVAGIAPGMVVSVSALYDPLDGSGTFHATRIAAKPGRASTRSGARSPASLAAACRSARSCSTTAASRCRPTSASDASSA